MDNERFEKGLKTLNSMNTASGERIMNKLKDICPEMARFVVEFPYGDIWSRPGLPVKTRCLITIASLTTLGYAKAELVAHINNALNAGCTKEEIIETVMYMSVYAGFPASLNALFVVEEVLKEQGLLEDSKS